QDLTRPVDEDAALALTGGGYAPDARPRRQPSHHGLRTARERRPEALGVEVEAAEIRHRRVDERMVRERFLRRTERLPARVEGDAAPGPRPGMGGEEYVRAPFTPGVRGPRGWRRSADVRPAGDVRSRPSRSRSDAARRPPWPRRCAASRSRSGGP